MNPYGRSGQEQREYERLLYPGTDVLVNKPGFRHPVKLEIAEREAALDRLGEPLPADAKQISVQGVKAIHLHLLQDIYDWAGSFRQYTTGRGAAPFAPPEFIEKSLSEMIDKLKGEKLLHGLDHRGMTTRSAHYVNELNAIHPFVEGNGRMQRTWLRNLCEQAGYHLEFRPGDREAWNSASAYGFHKTDDKMAAFLSERLQPLAELSRDTQQLADPSRDRLSQLRERYQKSDLAASSSQKPGNGQRQ